MTEIDVPTHTYPVMLLAFQFFNRSERDKFLCPFYCLSVQMNVLTNHVFPSPGVRTEQDLYIRLIDSMTKQVSNCFFFFYNLNKSFSLAPGVYLDSSVSPSAMCSF